MILIMIEINELDNVQHSEMIEQYVWIIAFVRKTHSLATDIPVTEFRIEKYQRNIYELSYGE